MRDKEIREVQKRRLGVVTGTFSQEHVKGAIDFVNNYGAEGCRATDPVHGRVSVCMPYGKLCVHLDRLNMMCKVGKKR